MPIGVLFVGEATFGHDNILWHYPIFQFYSEAVLRGDFPYWNPFSHGGEPFYVLLGQLRLLDPVTFLVVRVGDLFTDNALILFGWDRITRSLILAFGVYIVYRPFTSHLLTRISLIPLLIYSSFMLAPFRQDAFLDQIIWVPYLTLFLLKIVFYKDYRWRNWLFAALLTGISWQSYMFTGTWIFLLLLSLGFVMFRRDLLFDTFKSKYFIPKFVVATLIIIGMAAPVLSLFPSKDLYVYPPRMIDYDYSSSIPIGSPVQHELGPEGMMDDSFRMPYGYLTHTGTFSTIWDFIQAISPEGNPHSRGPTAESWGKPSEAFIYLSLLAWMMIINNPVLQKFCISWICNNLFASPS